MQWLPDKVRDTLVPQSENFREFGHVDKISRKDREMILQETDSTCRYCGGKYPKYLICHYIGKKRCNDVSCRPCYLVTHLNYGILSELKLYYSLVSQLEIVKKSVDFVISHNRIPTPLEVDPVAKHTPISLLEYINVINNYDTIPPELANYKLFVSEKLNIEFIMSNYGHKIAIFIDEDEENVHETYKLKLVKHNPTKEELDLFHLHFGS